jgi:YD repeat-containing protein
VGDLVTTISYTAAGERTSIAQSFPGGASQRQMTYDTLGRMVAQTEPNTGTWQYAYNDSGDVVGLMDPRGCGKVVYHDGLGRVAAEDYSPCPSSDAPAYSAPNLTTGDGTEAFTTYDGYGNVAREADRAQVSVSTYDARNRLVEVDRQVAVPGASDLMASRYAPHVFTKKILGYSEANRPLVSDTGADTFNLQGAFGDSELTVGYALDGSLETATSSYGALISDRQTDAIGQTFLELFGDAAGTLAYMTDDYEGRLTGYDLQRSVGPWAGYVNGGPPSSSDFTLQSTLAQLTLAYDMVGNPVSITQSSFAAQQGGGDGDDGDGGNPGTLNEWPQGGLPTTSRTMTYWDDYRLNAFSASYDSPAGDDISGLAGNPYTATELSAATYPAPGPVSTGNRVRSQTFGYDLRGNVLTSTDDANDLWDRSLGPVTYVPGSDQLATTDAGGAATYDAAACSSDKKQQADGESAAPRPSYGANVVRGLYHFGRSVSDLARACLN